MDKDSLEAQFQTVLENYDNFYQWDKTKNAENAGKEPAGIAAIKKADDKKAIARSNPLDIKGSDSLKESFHISPVQETPPPTDTTGTTVAPGFSRVRFLINGQYGIRLQSTGDNSNSAHSRILMQTYGASYKNPYIISIDQHILTPFLGSGQFDIVQRDSSDVDVFNSSGVKISGGTSKVTLATKSGFTNGITTAGGWSHLVKPITVDKTYTVVFVPGTAGDGIFSISARDLKQPVPTIPQSGVIINYG